MIEVGKFWNFPIFDGRFSPCCAKSTPKFFRQKTLIFSPSFSTKNFDPYSFSPTPTFCPFFDFGILPPTPLFLHRKSKNFWKSKNRFLGAKNEILTHPNPKNSDFKYGNPEPYKARISSKTTICWFFTPFFAITRHPPKIRNRAKHAPYRLPSTDPFWGFSTHFEP